MNALTQEQRDAHKAQRLKHAADPNDGLTIRFLKQHGANVAGSVGVFSKSRALALIAAGTAELAE